MPSVINPASIGHARQALLLGCLLLAQAICPSSSAAATAAGCVQVIKNRVTATADGVERPLRIHLPVFENDILRTFEDSRGQFLFSDESQLSMGPLSEVSVSTFFYQHEAQHETLKMVLDYGRGFFSFSAGNITGNPEGVEQRTPLFAMGIRGTEVAVSVAPEKDAIAVLYHGPVQVTDRETGEAYILHEGQMISKTRGEKAQRTVIPKSFWKRVERIAIVENPPGPAIPAGSPCRH